MKHRLLFVIVVFISLATFTGCIHKNKTPKIGVAFGVGPAVRWDKEKIYMEQYAKDLGADIEVRINKDEKAKPFDNDCYELIDSGIDVLIVRARDTLAMGNVVEYAKKKKVKIICYAALILEQKVDLFVGYDCNYIGLKVGQFLAEMVPEGDYIIFSGDPKDKNVSDLLYNGAMRSLNPIKDNINIILDASVPSWSPVEAKRMAREAIIKNGNKIDAILAPNDKIAGACVEVIAELGITTPVVITGMDAEEDALRRVLEGKQSCTVFMSLQILAQAAVRQAVFMSQKEKPEVNYELDNGSSAPIPASLITGQLVIKENLRKIFPEM